MEQGASTLYERMTEDLYYSNKVVGHEGESHEVLSRMYINFFGRDRYEFLRKQFPEAISVEDLKAGQAVLEKKQYDEIMAERAKEKQNGSA